MTKRIFRNLFSFLAGAIIFLVINTARSRYGVSQIPILIILILVGVYIGVKSKDIEFLSFMGGYLVAYLTV
jgi:hypothetical protein